MRVSIQTKTTSAAARCRRARLAAGVLLAVALILSTVAGLAAPARASAWANGADHGNGYGTHDWILDEGLTIAAGRGGGAWADRATALAATDDPDTQLHDFVNHVYQTTGHVHGSAPARIQVLNDQAVTQLRAGDHAGASVTLGLLAHYYGDICNPLHTDQMPTEEKIHSRYETRVNRDTSRPGQNASWVVLAPETATSDEAGRAVAAAAHARVSYAELVTDYSANGYDARVQAITAESLSSAANGLADIVDDIGRQAGVSVAAQTGASGATSSVQVAATSSEGTGAVATRSAESSAATGSPSAPIVQDFPKVLRGLALAIALVVAAVFLGLARSRKR